MKLGTIAGCATVSLAMLAGYAGAQELRGRVVGTVVDNSGAVLPGVTVTASSPSPDPAADHHQRARRDLPLPRPCRPASTPSLTR